MRLCLVIVLVFYMSTHVRLMRCDHQCTVILIELPCIFFLPEILDIQGFSASTGITEPVLESFPGRAFSVYSVFVFSSRCNFGLRYGGVIVPVVTLKIKLILRRFRCNFVFPVRTTPSTLPNKHCTPILGLRLCAFAYVQSLPFQKSSVIINYV